jgi:hypothetical protein
MSNSLGAARQNLHEDGQLVLSRQRALVNMGIISDHGGLGGLVSNTFQNNTKLDWYETHGSPAQQAAVKSYKDAVSTYAATYGKALSSANAVGSNAPTSDSARAQANELNDFGLGPTALQSHLNTNLAEMDNKKGSWDKQVQIVQRRIDTLIDAPQQQAKPGDRKPPAGATKTATGPNGQKAALVNGHWVIY